MKTTIAPIGAAPATAPTNAATNEPTTATIGTAPTTAPTKEPTLLLLEPLLLLLVVLHQRRYYYCTDKRPSTSVPSTAPTKVLAASTVDKYQWVKIRQQQLRCVAILPNQTVEGGLVFSKNITCLTRISQVLHGISFTDSFTLPSILIKTKKET
jgi:hypothetical protein